MRAAIVSAIALVGLSACMDAEQAAVIDDPCGIQQLDVDWTASPALRACAERGDPRAQAYLAMIHWSASKARFPNRERQGLDPSLSDDQLRAEGRRLMEIAAAQGAFEAQTELGLAHLEGLYGVPKDINRALALLTAADKQNDPHAAYILARMYHAGIGAAQSESETVRLLWRASSYGYQPAFCALALLGEKGSKGAHAAELDRYVVPCASNYPDVADDFK